MMATNIPPRGGESRPVRLGYADALRAGAIFLTLVRHTYHAYPITLRLHRFNVFESLELIGDLGVAILFMLSGYLLGGRYVRALLAEEPLPRVSDFLFDRFLRIYPLYFGVLLIATAVTWFAASHGLLGFDMPTRRDFFSHLSFTHGFSAATIVTIDGPMWTMPVDAQFYVVLPVGAMILVYALRNTSQRVRPLVIVGFALILASVVIRALTIKLHPEVLATWITADVALRQLVGMAPQFVFGIALGAIVPRVRLTTTLTVALVFLAVTVYLAYSAGVGHHPMYPAHLSNAWVLWTSIQEVDISIAAAAVFVLVACATGPVKLFVSSPYVRIAADLSYAIYLVHVLILGLIGTTFAHLNQYVAFILVLSTVVVCSGIFAIPLHLFVEKPFLSLKQRRRENALGQRGPTSSSTAETSADAAGSRPI